METLCECALRICHTTKSTVYVRLLINGRGNSRTLLEMGNVNTEDQSYGIVTRDIYLGLLWIRNKPSSPFHPLFLDNLDTAHSAWESKG